MSEKETSDKPMTAKDFATDQDVRWCPGCGDYSILKQVQSVLADEKVSREDTVFISGIGCSSRFPYYMETYGMHSIHGRAFAVASGLKAARKELSVWVITGDGDSLSIGGNHLIHLLRRNFDMNVLLFNNEIYGLTKGQYSPTSRPGTVTKSTPMGSIDHPFNPLSLCLGAESTFIARTMDRDPMHMREVLKEANNHKGTSMVEIYQNCNVFNDGAFFQFTEKASKADNTLQLKHGQPLVFGAEMNKGIRLDGFQPKIVELGSDYSENDLWVHDKNDRIKASMLCRFFEDPTVEGNMPRPFGVFFQEDRFCYEEAMEAQMVQAETNKGKGQLQDLLSGSHIWTI